MKKVCKIFCIIIGVILLIDGVYTLSKHLSNTSDATKDIESVTINETISDKDGVNFCVTNVDNLKSVGNGITEITTENNFIVLHIKITNNSNKPYDVNALRFLLVEGENEYEYSSDALLAFDNHMYMDTINPNLTKEYVIVYETSSTTNEKEYMLKVKPVNLSEKGSIYVTLRGEK